MLAEDRNVSRQISGSMYQKAARGAKLQKFHLKGLEEFTISVKRAMNIIS